MVTMITTSWFHTCRNAPLLWADEPCWIPVPFPHSCHLSGAYESCGSTSHHKSLVVLSAWQVNVNLNQWLLPLYPLPTRSVQSPPFYSVCKLPFRKHKHTYVSAALLHFKPTETHQLNNKNLRWWRTKECLQRTEGRVDEGDHWMTKLRKVLSPHLVRLEFIMAVFKTPP